jgi:transposase
VKPYPGEDYVRRGRRAADEPDYGRRGLPWVHGAFEPATGEAVLTFSTRRDSASHIALLEQVVATFPSGRPLLIADNLSIHHSRDTQAALLAWPDVRLQFLPTYAAWLNLIEPWWKLLKALALKGRRFETVAELEAAFRDALAYWTAHRRPFTWRKRPQGQPTRVLAYLHA